MDPVSLTDEDKVKRDASSVVLEIEKPSSEPSTPRTPIFLKADGTDVPLRFKVPLPSPSSDGNRRSAAAEWLATANKRQHDLTNLQILCKSKITATSKDGSTKITQSGFCELFSCQEVLQYLFQLFEPNENDKVPSTVLIEFLNDQLKSNGWGLKSILESAVYVLAEEDDLDFSLFSRIFSTSIVQEKMYLYIDKHKEGRITLEAFMDFIKDMTMPKLSEKLSPEQVNNAEKIFSSYIKEGCSELTFEDFKKVIPCKNPFFAERAFRLFDKDGSNTISTVEFRETLEQFNNQDSKILFLFQIYDLNGDGMIQLTELRDVLAACSEENGMKFSEEQLDQLAIALYEDAENCDVDEGEEDENRAELGISFEKIQAQMAKQPGLLTNLSTSLDRFLVPTVPASGTNKRTFTFPRIFPKFSPAYFRNNYTLVIFLAVFFAVHLILFVTRAIQFKDNNGLYILARAAGQTLNFNCSFVVVLMLRKCITWLRRFGFASILPLDNHVYLHKVCGITIVFFSVLHTAMHLINIPLNIADKLNSTVTNKTHSAAEWLFTPNPQMFGLIPGWACLTGWALVLVLAIMFVFSLPFVRKSGKFEIFYWTHILYYPFWILLIIHGPRFWQWFIGPAVLFICLEKVLQFMKRWSQKGRTFISSADLLPSRVTHLTIKKPPNFHFHPGDYVFVQIPSLANYEWHPFTISSAPELPDHLWLHIRCAGGWTNSLYAFFEKQIAKRCCESSIAAGLANCERCSKQLKRIKSSDSKFGKLKVNINKKTSKDSSENPAFKKTQFSSIYNIQRNQRYTTSRIVSMPVPITSDLKTNNVSKEAHRHQKFRNNKPKNAEPTPRDIFAPETKKEIAFRSKSLAPLEHPDNDSGVRTTRPQVRKAVSFYPTNKEVQPQRPSVLSDDLIKDSVNGGLHQQITAPELQVTNESGTKSVIRRSRQKSIKLVNEELHIDIPLEIIIDGPYGAPSSHIFRAEHAVLIAAGIGVTPFASILQSIMNRYYTVRQTCPSCQHNWVGQMPESIMNLKKVDFFWINRDQRSFEWFVNLLSQLEVQQAEFEGSLEKFLDLHMYITSALNKTDMKAVGLQMAMDLLYAKEKRDLITGLKTRTNAGRPNWSKMFQKIQDENKGKVTVFYCGPPQLATELKEKCDSFGFRFRKEIF